MKSLAAKTPKPSGSHWCSPKKLQTFPGIVECIETVNRDISIMMQDSIKSEKECWALQLPDTESVVIDKHSYNSLAAKCKSDLQALASTGRHYSNWRHLSINYCVQRQLLLCRSNLTSCSRSTCRIALQTAYALLSLYINAPSLP